jgi:hypothetical protein
VGRLRRQRCRRRREGARDETCRREDAYVRADPLVAADALHLVAPEHAQELRLELDVEVADLVDEERAAVRLFEDTDARLGRTGERAALVTEERGLEERARHGGKVEDDERSGRARALLVERLGEDLLAGARLSFDHDGNVDRGEPRAQRIEASHLDALADELAEPCGGGERCGSGGRGGVDAQRGLPDAHDLTPRREKRRGCGCR